MNKECIYCGEKTAIFNGNNYYCMNCDKEWSDSVSLSSDFESDSNPRTQEVSYQPDEPDEDEIYSPI